MATKLEKPDLSFWQLWNLSFAYIGIQLGYSLQGQMSGIYSSLGADDRILPLRRASGRHYRSADYRFCERPNMGQGIRPSSPVPPGRRTPGRTDDGSYRQFKICGRHMDFGGAVSRDFLPVHGLCVQSEHAAFTLPDG